MKFTMRPYDDPIEVTLELIATSLDAILGSTVAKALDVGQYELLREAQVRIEQVGSEMTD